MQDAKGVISSCFFLAGAKPHALRCPFAPLGGLNMDSLKPLRWCEMAPAGEGKFGGEGGVVGLFFLGLGLGLTPVRGMR
jgi:hypothetical protein